MGRIGGHRDLRGTVPFPSRGQRTRSWVLRYVPQALLLRPFELWLSGLCAIAGAPLLFGAPSPTSLEALLPTWLVHVWGAELVVGAVLVALGLFKPRKHWERLGQTLLGTAALVYGLAIFEVLGLRGTIAATITVSYGLAAITRAFTLRMAEQLIREVVEASEDDWPREGS